jgi:HSP20 family molecular chaperone IbpA
LTISAEKKTDESETDKTDGRIIRRERYVGSMTRSWYVGDKIKQEDIKAKYNNGVLSLTIPKEEEKPELPEDKKYIAID